VIPSMCRTTYDHMTFHLKNQPPSLQHWFGTDDLGRDLFVRTWYGARISLCIGLTVSVLNILIGFFYGATAGMIRGRAGAVMIWVADVLYALPRLLLGIIILSMLKATVWTLILSLSITGWINMARFVRGQVLKIRPQSFILAAQMFGLSTLRIIWKHLIPNTMGPLLPKCIFTVSLVIFAESFFSLMGLGIAPSFPTWGSLIREGLSALRYYPWRWIFPSSLMTVTILFLNLFGDAMQHLFTPKLRR